MFPAVPSASAAVLSSLTSAAIWAASPADNRAPASGWLGLCIEDDADESCRGLEIDAETFQVGFQVDGAVLRAAGWLPNPQLVGAGFQALDLELAPVIGLRPSKLLAPRLNGAQVSTDQRLAGRQDLTAQAEAALERKLDEHVRGAGLDRHGALHGSRAKVVTLACDDLPLARRQVFEGEVPLGIRRRDLPLGVPRGADLDIGQIGRVQSGDGAGDRAAGFQHDVHVHGLSVDLDRLGGTVLRETRGAGGEEVLAGFQAGELELSAAVGDRL